MMPALFAPAAAAATLPNATLNPAQAKLTREPNGEMRVYFSGSTDQLPDMLAGSWLVKPGKMPHPAHTHPEEEFLLVTEGTGEIALEGKVTKVGPGSMMYCSAGKLHGITNIGATPMLFYFIKWRGR